MIINSASFHETYVTYSSHRTAVETRVYWFYQWKDQHLIKYLLKQNGGQALERITIISERTGKEIETKLLISDRCHDITSEAWEKLKDYFPNAEKCSQFYMHTYHAQSDSQIPTMFFTFYEYTGP